MRMVNAMTVDVEDFFQASIFDRVVARSSSAGRESRVVANTHSRLGGARHDLGLGRTRARLRRLVRDFAFDTVAAALEWRAPAAVPAVVGWAHAK